MTKATFGATPEEVDTSKITKSENQRTELGAIWENVSLKSNNTYMKIVLTLPKSELVKLVKDAGDNDKTKVNFIAFHNKDHEKNAKSPKYRIYKDSRKS